MDGNEISNMPYMVKLTRKYIGIRIRRMTGQYREPSRLKIRLRRSSAIPEFNVSFKPSADSIKTL